jgi:hypothetical protein
LVIGNCIVPESLPYHSLSLLLSICHGMSCILCMTAGAVVRGA